MMTLIVSSVMLKTTNPFELSVAIIGAILNAMVLEVYSQLKPNMRHKVSNILLASQALIDILNTVFRGIPFSLFHVLLPDIFHTMGKEYAQVYADTASTLYFFSFYCSMFLFTLIAVERYYALSKSLWHRQNVTESWIRKRFVIVLIAAVIGTLTQMLLFNF